MNHLGGRVIQGVRTILLAWMVLGTFFTASAYAQYAPLSPERISLAYNFGTNVQIRAWFPNEISVSTAQVFLRAAGAASTYTASVSWESQNQFFFELDLTRYPLRPFTSVVYWFELDLADGSRVILPEEIFFYEDNRFDWQTRRSPPFQVHWYEGDPAFVQSILDVATAGRDNIGSLIESPEIQQVEIYVYARAKDLRDALQPSTQKWVGAHADPDLGVMLVALPEGPDQRLEMERQIPHELAHIVLYHKLGDAYQNLPTWFNEGLASIAELYPNPDYYVLLDSAFEQRGLLPMETICQGFPGDASGTYLAYAQSTSFTRYIQRQYGVRGLEDLLQQYAGGVECKRGVELALGAPFSQLERDWRQAAFGERPLQNALANLLPWLGVGLVVLGVPLGLALRSTRSDSASSPLTR